MPPVPLPPAFQEATRCDICKCSFNTFRRRHHCRCCGRTLCHEHSSNQMALPQFDIPSSVRVCADCFNNSCVSVRSETGPLHASSGVDTVADNVSRLDIGANVSTETESIGEHHSAMVIPDCKCGMPLCICETPTPYTVSTQFPGKQTSSVTTSHSRPKKMDVVPKSRGSTSSSNPCSLFNCGLVADDTTGNLHMDYGVNGEGLREAIKNNNIAAVKKLLEKGVDANYRDKQGLPLLHLAAMFNHSEIAFALMDFGASVEQRNAQGETPLDCAPATLQYNMRKKLEEKKSV